MLSKTLQDGLNDYGIEARIRALRRKRNIGLVDLGKHRTVARQQRRQRGEQPSTLDLSRAAQLRRDLPTEPPNDSGRDPFSSAIAAVPGLKGGS